jgi:isoleucyl-tRNA synthetase
MSKSLGNSIEAENVVKQSGADILRLWVSMSDYRGEIRVSNEILTRAAEAYRKIRNTLRYLVANLYDFNPAADALDRAQMEEVDRYILARYADTAQRLLKAYDGYDYGTIYQTLNAFVTVDLSAFYADVSKDRLYTFAAGSRERRSAQTAMYVMADGLARLLAPILSFTADELWRFLPARVEPSVHIARFPAAEALSAWSDAALLERWAHLTDLRDKVLGTIEPLRKDKQIGSSLQAKVVLSANGQQHALFSKYAADLPMLFIVSEVELQHRGAGNADGVAVRIERAGGVKCERCWRYVPSVSQEPRWAGLCERCQGALQQAG